MKAQEINSLAIVSLWPRLFGVLLTISLMTSSVIAAGPATVVLGAAGSFKILAESGITTTGVTSITGDIGVSPIDHTAITGFSLTLDGTGAFSTSSLVTGKVYASDYTPATHTMLISATGDMEAAYTDAAGRVSPDFVNPYTGDVTGQTLTPGLYHWTTGVQIAAAGVTISGSASDIWIFQIAQDLTVANGAIVTLSGGAQASNIFWQVAGQVTLGTTAAMKGIILSHTQIAMSTGAMLIGQALAQTTVTLQANSVMPVELVKFTATANSMSAELRWSTATEVHDYGFEIQRRQRSDWTKVGFVAGAGSTNSPRSYSYIDNILSTGSYSYRLKQIDNDGSFAYGASVDVAITGSPQAFMLSQNYPNPFNPSTVISYQLAVDSHVTLKVYDVLGKEVATLVNGEMKAGSYAVTFGTNEGTSRLSSGVYFYRLQAGPLVSMKKLVLMK